jgi:hypothetical protein
MFANTPLLEQSHVCSKDPLAKRWGVFSQTQSFR